jgi:DNA-binding transcriptional regulator YhcF (GntR family)
MPKDLPANTEILYSRNSFTQISVADIQRLQAARLSGTTTRVYLLLKQHCYGSKTTCFPSLRRLAEMLEMKHKTAERTICRSLKELEDAGLIERNGRRKKNRFVLLPEKREQNEQGTSAKLDPNEQGTSANRRKQDIEKEKSTSSLYSPPQAEESKIQKTKKRKENYRKWKSPAERREAKAKRAAERAQRQRTAEREAQRTNPVERQKRLKNALDWIALRMPVECLMEGDKEHLEGVLDEWINGLSPHRRKLFDIKSDRKFRSLMIARIEEL